jgi:hypothetical protein
MSAPLFARDPLTSDRYEVRIAGSSCPGLRTDSPAIALVIAGALLALGRAAQLRDRRSEELPRAQRGSRRVPGSR